MKLPTSQKIATSFVVLCLILLGFNPHSFSIGAAFVGALALFGFVFWSEVNKQSEIDLLKAELSQLKSRVDDIALKKSLSR